MSVPLLAHSLRFHSTLSEFRTAARSSSAVVCTWKGSSGTRGSVTVLPDGCSDVMWNGEVVTVAGVQSGAISHEAQRDTSVGVRLRPGVLGPLLSLPAGELGRGPVDLADVCGGTARTWSRRLSAAAGFDEARVLLEQLVVDRLTDGRQPDPLVDAAARRLGRPGSTIDEVARGTGLSTRELRRRFRRDVGLGPKHLQRITRFHRLVLSLGAVVEQRTTLTASAVALGYADQAHAGRECREFSGRTPRALINTWTAHSRAPEVPVVAPRASDGDRGPATR